MSMKKHTLWGLAVVAALAVGVVLGIRFAPAGPAATDTAALDGASPASASVRQAPVTVRVASVSSEDFTQRLTAVGSLRADESVVMRPEVAGRVQFIGFREGQPVEKGQVLFRLDDATARAELAQADAALALARSQHGRARELSRQGFVSQQALDDAASQLRVQQAALEAARVRLDKTVLRAPFDGVIGLRSVSVGDYVTAGQDLVALQALDPLKLDFKVPEQYLAHVAEGQQLDIQVDALPGQTRTGRVFAISPTVDANGRSVWLRAEVENGDGALRPGLFARVALLLSSYQGLAVPEAALAPSGDGQYVYVVADDEARQVAVTLGQRRDGMVEVSGDLASGDVVIVAGLQRISDGVPVRVQVRE